MATKTVAVGGGNWNAPGTWVEGSIATSVDDVVFTGASGQLTVNVASAAKTINFTGYTNTITFNATLTVSGSVTLISGGFTTAGASGITVNAAATLTSNGRTWDKPFVFSGTNTFTLADNWAISGLVSCSTGTINGNQITASGGWSVAGSAGTPGTTTVRLTGGTYTGGAATLFSVASITFAGNVTISSASSAYFGCSLTYESGIVTTAGSTFRVDGGSTTNPTLNLAGITFNNFEFGGNGNITTLTSDIATTNLAHAGAAGIVTINGFAVNVTGNLSAPTLTSGSLLGTTQINLTGSGTWSMNGSITTGSFQNNIVFNTAGTITIGAVQYKAGTITYTAGTINQTGTITFPASATLNTNGMTWNGTMTISTSGTVLTLSSNLRNTGTTGLITTTTGTATFAGAGAWDCDNVRFATGSSTATTGVAITLQSGNTYRCRNSLLIGGTKTGPSTIQGSSVGGTKATLTLDTSGTQGVVYVTAIDINSNGGRLIRNLLGTDTRTQNWQEVITLMPVAAYVFVQ